jgi:hypothetical protein
METMPFFKIGTCSWKYDSWQGLVYSQDKGISYLLEYRKHFRNDGPARGPGIKRGMNGDE